MLACLMFFPPSKFLIMCEIESRGCQLHVRFFTAAIENSMRRTYVRLLGDWNFSTGIQNQSCELVMCRLLAALSRPTW